MGKLIAFSGIDGAGKSTQINHLKKVIKGDGGSPYYLWTRGGYTGLFNFVKTVLRKSFGRKFISSGRTQERTNAFSKPWVRNAWLTFAIFDLILVYGLYLRYLKAIGRTVIADRYLWDTWIDFRLNFPQANIDKWFLWKLLVWVTPKPDNFFLLLIPVKESLRRSKLKDEPFPDSKEVLSKRVEYYKKLSVLYGWQVIDCTKSVDDVFQDILAENPTVKD